MADTDSLAFFEVVSDRKSAEERLRAQATLLQQVIDAIPEAILAQDLQGRVTLANATFAARRGFRRDEILGLTFGQIGLESLAIHEGQNARVVAEGRPIAYEDVTVHHDDGLAHPHAVSKAPLRGDDGGVIGVVTMATDVSHRVAAEQALARSERIFRTLFENAGDGLFTAELDGRLIDVNHAFARNTGYSREELRNMRISDVLPPGSAEQVRAHAAALVESGNLVLDSVHLRRDGSRFEVELQLSLIDLDDRLAVLGIARDVSERRRAERERDELQERLRQAQKMEEIGQLAGGIAHDFNNLLTAIRGNATLARAEIPDGSSASEDLEQIEQAADRAASLTRQLLAYARKSILQPAVIDLAEVVRDVEPMLRRLLGEDVTLVTLAAREPAHVLADPGQMEQVIVNLAVNARDAMPAGGRLTMQISNVTLDAAFAQANPAVEPGPHVVLSVSDTGTGMSAETLRHVFEPFFTTKRPGKGTGLGLATVQGIVSQSGGCVTVSSTPGRGTQFTVFLPRVDTGKAGVHDTARASDGAAAPGAAALVSEPEPEPRAGRALVVEDDERVRRFVTRALSGAGYWVRSASSGADALSIPLDEVDILVTDVVMPAMSGIELSARILERRPDLPVLFMSGHPDPDLGRHGVLGPDVNYLPKPFTRAALIDTVDRLVGRTMR